MYTREVQAPKRTGLLELIYQSQGSQFVIPVYQRNYTWTTGKEVKQFLVDLKEVLIGNYKRHFMGIMIYLDTPIDFSSRELSIVDGQQRLTTVFLLLYAVKELMLKNGQEKEAEALNNQYLINYSVNNNLKYKLKPLVADDTVYEKIVTGKLNEIVEKNSNIYKNYIYIRDFLEKESETYTLNDILMALNQLFIVCIPISQQDNPQKIFESINATGVKLTAADLIRNFLLMSLNSAQQDFLYKNYWKKLEELFSNDSKELEAFFRLYLAAKKRKLPNKNAVYATFVDWVKNDRATAKIEEIFEDIVNYAQYYDIIYKKDLNSVDSKLKDSIYEFRKIDSEMPAPLFLELYSLMECKKIAIEQLNEIIVLTNIYLMRRALCGLDTSDITRLFPSLLNDILNECRVDYSKLIECLKRYLINKNKGNSMEMPDDIRLYNSIINANMYTLKATRIFFDKLEHVDNPAPVDLSKLSIEHLMPQSPTKGWLDKLHISEEIYQRNLHRLGNLTLASKIDNSKMQNKSWEYKNAILASTNHLKINEGILRKKGWSIDDIEERTKELIQQIQRLYPYFELNGESIVRYPIYIDSNGIVATGIFYEVDGSVEIEEGSQLNISFDNATNYPEIEDWREELLTDGIICKKEQGFYFAKNHITYPKTAHSTALSATASLILHGSRNGWKCWLVQSGKPIETDTNLRNKFSKSNESEDQM